MLPAVKPRGARKTARAGATDYSDAGLVFATGKGTPIDTQNIVNRFFKPLLKRAELPEIRWHDLRHTYATLLLSRGTHPTYVQKSLGHASVQLTLDRYSPATRTGYLRWAVQPRRAWTKLWDSYCCPTAARAPGSVAGGFSFLRDLQEIQRADERTRTADLLITSDRSCVAGVCRGLQIPHS